MTYNTIIRSTAIDDVSDWVWPKDDDGLWLGPSQEWTAIKPYISENCKSFENAVQAGGGCGMFPRLLSNMFTYVYTFEPDPYNFYCLSQNCQSQNIYKFNCAVGHENRKVVFHAPHESNRGTGTVHRDIDSPEIDKLYGDVVMMKLDNFEFSSLGLIYFDIENSEIYALRGSINTITKHSPLIICESAGEEVHNLLKNLGYSDIAKSGADTVFKIV
ncbi:fkbM_fam, methyltransferase, FkbM family [uncultured Caudovirales phage]|uniref:FkbM_fam, methyltransferase, FkbM family n=1 Tax=uncultured Caudovirales phage TaxID=2100421 RepID=A0A6J7WSV5_9CAUD|nr:fkbM_fam, methyltransferase, FkbM family [uncultured Caudovirales phage]